MLDYMELFNQGAHAWQAYVVQATWQSSLVTMLLLALAWLCRKRSAPLRYAILLVALIKFVVPPMMALPTGAFSWIPPAPPVQEAAVTQASIEAIPGPLESADPMPDTTVAAAPGAAPLQAASPMPPPSPVIPSGGDIPVAAGVRIPYSAVLLLLHLSGMLAILIWITIIYAAIRRYARHSAPVDERLQIQADKLRRSMGLRRDIELLVSSGVPAPISIGFRRPRILLPRAFPQKLSPEEMDTILAHEFAHHKRRDLWVLMVENLLLAVWWFNPFLWLLVKRIRKVREDCCDDLVLTMKITDTTGYCESLVNAAANISKLKLGYGTLGFADALHPLGRRIKRIMATTHLRATRLTTIGLLSILALALVALPGIRTGTAQEEAAAEPAKEQVNELPQPPAWADIPGEQIFRGKYTHFSRNHERGYGWLDIKQAEDGSICVMGSLEFYPVITIAQTDPELNLSSYQSYYQDKTSQKPTFYAEKNIAKGTVHMIRMPADKAALEVDITVPDDACFDPNTRPDTYTVANVLSRSLQLKAGETRELKVYDTDITGESLVSYTLAISDQGQEEIAVPAGVFNANHIVIKQLSSANTWFKKRAGHITEMWVLDNGVIVRILRHREPYELQLTECAHIEKLPGYLPGKKGAKATAPATPEPENVSGLPLPDPASLPGTLEFQGTYTHRSRGGTYPEPSQLWLRRNANGGLHAAVHMPKAKVYQAVGNVEDKLLRYLTNSERYTSTIKCQETQAIWSRKGNPRGDFEQKAVSVPVGSIFDPNTRPDPYAAANIILRSLDLREGERKEIEVYDIDNAGEDLVPYTIAFTHKGKEEIIVQAGKFTATHIQLEQVTSADTWFKKRAGHITDFWTLDNGVILRIVRHREPYEVELKGWSFPEVLPGLIEKRSNTEKQVLSSDTGEKPQQRGDQDNTAGRILTVEGTPIKSAVVSLGTHTAETDKDGYFTLMGGIGDAKKGLRIDKEGFPLAEYELSDLEKTNRIYTIILPEAAQLSGQVCDSDGTPVANASLYTMPVKWKDPDLPYTPMKWHSASFRVTTDAQGYFQVSRVCAGNHWLVVHQQNGSSMYYQLVLENPVEIVAGKRYDNLKFVLHPVSANTISGKVTDGNGRPISNMTVEAFIPHDVHWSTQTTTDGTYTLSGLDGMGRDPIRIYFQTRDLSGIENYKLFLPEVPLWSTNADLILHDEGSISGTVFDQDSHPIEVPNLRIRKIRLKDSDVEAADLDIAPEPGAAPGAFVFPRVAAGVATLELTTEEGNKQRHSVVVHPGEKTAEVNITQQQPCLLKGHVTVADMRGNPGRGGGNIRDAVTDEDMGWFSADANGTYSVENLPAGEYLVLGLYQRHGEWYQTQRVRLEHGKTTHQDFVLGGTNTVTCSVNYPDKDYNHAMVYIRKPGVAMPPDYENGRPRAKDYVVALGIVQKSGEACSIMNVPKGDWEVIAIAKSSIRYVGYDNLPHASSRITLKSNETVDLGFDL